MLRGVVFFPVRPPGEGGGSGQGGHRRFRRGKAFALAQEPGQFARPVADFPFHALVTYEGKYCDPSYKKEYLSLREHYFLINLKHGAVYHLGPEKIEKVAQLQPVPEERTIRGRRLFIEDRDNGVLIFFAPVSLLGPRDRLPKMRLILTREAFEEVFGKVELKGGN